MTDTFNHRIQTFAPSGTYLAQRGAIGAGEGQFHCPFGIAADGSGAIYVTDRDNHRAQKFASDGGFLLEWGDSGAGPGQFRAPMGVAADITGAIYVSDSDNHRVQKFAYPWAQRAPAAPMTQRRSSMRPRFPHPMHAALLLLLLVIPGSPPAVQAAAGDTNPPAKAPKSPGIKNASGGVKRAQDLVVSLEAGTYKGDREALGKSVETAERDLQTYARRNPNDDAGVLLMMRLYEAGMRSRMYDLSHKAGGFDTTASLGARMAALRDKITAPYNAVLDRALQRSPGNAEFHYWKGRLYALFEPLRSEGRLDTQHSTLPQAVRELRLAVSASPNEVKYREALAALLLANSQEVEAVAIYKEMSGGRHPMYLLLHDWERVKLPQKTAADPAGSASLVRRAQFAGKGYALARSRAFTYPGTAAQFMGDCRQRWPAFRLVQRPAEKGEKTGLKSYGQIFTWKGDALVPTATTVKNLPKSPQSGIGVNVFEMRAPKSPKPDPSIGVPPGKIYCAIVLENYRDVEGK